MSKNQKHSLKEDFDAPPQSPPAIVKHGNPSKPPEGMIKFSSLAPKQSALPEKTIDHLANAIYRIEGGDNTKYPYGIKSIDTKGDKDKARRICMNTIRNNYKRWEDKGKPGEYMDYLANVYCPPSADPKGNVRWKKNIRAVSNLNF